MSAMAVSPWGKMPIDSSRGVPASTAAPAADSHLAAGAAFSIPVAAGRGRRAVSAGDGGPEGRKRLQVLREPTNAAEPDALAPTREGASMERGIDQCVTAGETATNPVAKASEDNGRARAATCALTAGEVSRGSDAASRQQSSRPGFAGDDGGRGVQASGGATAAITHSGAAGAISEPALMVLQLISAHHGCGLGRAVELAAFAYAEEIGLPALLDARRDIAAVPPFERSGQNRFSHTCESEPGRQEAPLGLLPMPHAPP